MKKQRVKPTHNSSNSSNSSQTYPVVVASKERGKTGDVGGRHFTRQNTVTLELPRKESGGVREKEEGKAEERKWALGGGGGNRSGAVPPNTTQGPVCDGVV